MDIWDKVVVALIGSGSSIAITIGAALISSGREKQQSETLQKNVEHLVADLERAKADLANIRLENVKRAEHEDDMLNVNGRIDRLTRDLETHMRDNSKMLYEIGRDVSYLTGRADEKKKEG